MRKRFSNYFDGQGSPFKNILAWFSLRRVIIVVSFVVATVLIGGIYIWYVQNYADARKVEIIQRPKLEYEWQQKAASNGLIVDYISDRTKGLMVRTSGNDKSLIVSNYILPGKLNYQVGEESGEYNLEDQALLLGLYVKDRKRLEATELVSEVYKRIEVSEMRASEQVMWLEAYFSFYASYGSKTDLGRIEELVSILFDEDGRMRPHTIEISDYTGKAYVAAVDEDKALESGATLSDLELNGSNTNHSIEDSGPNYQEGVILSDIDLRLIKDLENNMFLPQGSYEYNLNIVRDGLVSEDISLYSFAYCIEDNELTYIYSSREAGNIDVSLSLRTLTNLSEVKEVPNQAYSLIKTELYSTSSLGTSYSISSGKFSGAEDIENYILLMQIAINMDDLDLYEFCSQRLSRHVATLQTSPALYMIFREIESRNVVYASDNLMIQYVLK